MRHRTKRAAGLTEKESADDAELAAQWRRRRRRWGFVMAFSLLALGGSVYLDRGLLSVVGVVIALALFGLAYVRIRICSRCRRFVSHPGDRAECPHCGLPIRANEPQEHHRG